MGQLKGQGYNMTEHIPGGFIQRYDDPLISHTIEMDDDDPRSMSGTCTIHYHSGKTVSFHALVNSVYNARNGLPISSEHNMLFLGTWERGLFCYSTLTGELLWRYPRGRIKRILVFSNYLVVVRQEKEILKIDIKTGQMIDRLGSGDIGGLYDLQNGYALANRLRGKVCLIDPHTLQIVKRYNESIITPDSSYNTFILDAYLDDNQLVIVGVERKKKEVPGEDSLRDFTRVIDTF